MAVGRQGAGFSHLGAVLGAANAVYPTVAILGDSISANNTSAANFNSWGHMSQAVALLGQSIDFDHSLNFGVGGETSTQILSRVGTVISALAGRRSPRCAVLAGANDVSGGVAASSIISNIASIASALRAANIEVDLIPILPRTYNMDATKLATMQAANAGIISLAGVGVRLLRCDLAIMNTGYDDPLPNTLTDGLHPGTYGGSLMGAAIRDDYARFGGQFSRQISGTVLNPNPTLSGTGGTLGTGASGVAPTSYKIERNVGSTITIAGSKPATGAGHVFAVASPGGGLDLEVVRMLASSNISVTSYSTNDWFQLEGDVSVSGAANINAVFLSCNSTITGSKNALLTNGVRADRVLSSWRGRLRTQRFQLSNPATEALNAYLYIHANCAGGAAACNVQLSDFRLSKVA